MGHENKLPAPLGIEPDTCKITTSTEGRNEKKKAIYQVLYLIRFMLYQGTQKPSVPSSTSSRRN